MAGFLAPVAPFLALVLATAAIHKLVASDRLAEAAARLTGAPLRAGWLLSYLAATVEMLAAIALLFPASRPAGAVIATALWGLYAILLLVRRHDGEMFDCGCAFARPAEDRSHRGAALRPLLLAMLALAMLLLPAASLAIEPVCAAVAFFLLYVAAGEIIALPSLRHGATA